MNDKIMLTTIEVIIGKKKVTFPFLKLKSPGSLPITLHIIPTITNIIPIMIKTFPKSFNPRNLPIKVFIGKWCYYSSPRCTLNKTNL
jgi:hypothetical protein